MVRLTDRPDMTLDVYRGSKTTIQCNATITPHLKSTKNLNRKAAFGRPAIKITGGGGGGGGGRPTLALRSDLVPQTLSCLVCVEDS